MKAYVEWLHLPGDGWEGAVGIVRVGPQAEREPDPFDYSVTFKVIDGFAIARGGVMPSGDPEVFPRATRAHATAGVREVERITGLTFSWTHKGRTKIMPHPKAPIADDISEIFNADGTPAPQHLSKVLHSLGQILAGHTAVTNGKASQTDLGGGKFHVSIEFDRQD